MKTIKKLSIALLLSITSLQMTQAMFEGSSAPVEGPTAPITGFKPTIIDTIPEVDEGEEGEEGKNEGNPGSTISEGQKAAQSGLPTEGKQEGSTTSGVTDRGQPSLGGGADVEVGTDSGEEKSTGTPAVIAKKFGVTEEQASKLMSGESIEKQSKSFKQKVKDFFSKTFNTIASPFKALGKMFTDAYSRMKRLVKRNNTSLPEAEQVAPSTVNATAASNVLAEMLNGLEKMDRPLDAKEAEKFEKQLNDALETFDGISDADIATIKSWMSDRLEKVQENLAVKARKKSVLNELLSKTPLFTGEENSSSAPLQSQGTAVVEKSTDSKGGDILEGSSTTSSSSSLFEEGAGTEEQASNPVVTPAEPADLAPTLTREQQVIRNIANGYKDATAEEKQNLIKSLQKAASKGRNNSTSFKEFRKKYNTALEGTGLRMTGSGKITEAKEQTTTPSKGKRGKRSRSRR